MKKQLLWIAFAFCSMIAKAQLSGTYSIGGESPDYDSIVHAVADVVSQGVDGPVTFNIRNGLYEEGTIVIDSIAGASSTNTITFTSESGNADSVTIANDADIFHLNDAAWIHINKLSFSCYATNAKAIFFEKGSHGLQVTDNLFELAFLAYGVYRNETSTGQPAGDTIIVSNNTFNGGKAAIYIKNDGTKFSHFALVENNTIEEFYTYGIYLDRFSRTYDESGKLLTSTDGGGLVRFNKISSKRAINATAIQLVYFSDVVEVSFNEIIINGSYNITGLHQSNSNGKLNENLKWFNNFVYVSGTQTTMGLHMQNGYYNEYANNTIIVDPKGSQSYTNYYANSGSHYHYNNKYVNTGKLEADILIRHRAEQDPKNVILASDYNIYYNAGPNFALWKNEYITSFDTHNDSLLLDTNSIFEATGGFYVNEEKIEFCSTPSITGTPLDYVKVDLYNTIKDETNPQIGAIDYETTSPVSFTLTSEKVTGCGELTTSASIMNNSLTGGQYNWSFNDLDLGNEEISQENDFTENGFIKLGWSFIECMAMDSIEISVFELPEINITGMDSFCTGDTAKFSVSSNLVLDDILWNSGETSDSDFSAMEKTVSVTVKAEVNQCTNTFEFDVTELSAPIPTITDENGELMASEGVGNYIWTLDEEVLTEDTLQNLTVLTLGDYQVTVTYDNECSRTSEIYTATIIGIEDLFQNGSISIYPNPVTDILHLDFGFNASYKLTNSVGDELLSGKNKTLNVSDFKNGIYILQIYNEESFIGATKIMVK